MKIKRLMLAASAAIFFVCSAAAQNAGTVTNHAFAIGKGAGGSSYTSLLCGAGQIAMGQSAADPQCVTVSGDGAISAAGVLTLATVNSNVGSFGSATNCPSFTVNGKGLITAASATTCTPAVGSVTGLGTGVATFLATPSSANLRAALTDEVGTGAAYFVGGALGTPASATLTNATGFPLSGHTAQGAFTFVGNNTSGSASPTAVDIAALTTKTTPALTDYVMLSDQAASGAWKKATVASIGSSSLLGTNNTWTGTNTFASAPVTINDSGFTLPPFLNNERLALVLSGSMDGATQGETVQLFDTFGANSNGTIVFFKSGGGAGFTGSVTGNIMTVTAMQAGSLNIAAGQVVSAVCNPGCLPNGTLIQAFGTGGTTGTGTTGTYSLTNSTTGGNIGSESILTNDTPTNPTPTKNGQGMGFITAQGWYLNGGTPTRGFNSADIQFNAEGDFTSTSNPAGINFVTTPPGSTATTGQGNVLRVNIASTGALNQFQNGIGSTLTDGIALKNNTAAAAGAQQQSPSLHFGAQGWKTNATAGSQPVDWYLTNAPVQGAASPSTNLVFSYQINGGTITRAASLTPTGLDLAGGEGITIGGAAPTSGHVLRSNGTAFVDGQLSASDLSGLPLTFAQGGTNDTGTGATSFTPTVSFVGGSGTSASGSTGVYKQLAAKVYYVQMTLTISWTTIPTSFSVTNLPFTTAATGFLMGQNTSTGALCQTRSNATTSTTGNIIDYAGNLAVTTGSGGSPQTVVLTGVLTNQ